ncbi:carbohydrate-binding module family 13 protein [Hydnum rufescens UP504]|uniref:Carbohydrate-binding module family 13 protein n=1 Tax=Hydnum rufescens UP504 TaxID=1448309 RepID=A0A9P6AT50_9AGAM|nr:carbohydrate-binding module family 13 protein [Hydnum rufescens UP504]
MAPTSVFKNLQSQTVADLDTVSKKFVNGYPLSGHPNQQWILEHDHDDYYFIKNAGFGEYLSIEGDLNKPHDGTRVIGSAQKQSWKVTTDSSPTHRRIFYRNTQFVVDLDRGLAAPGTPIQLWTSGGTPNQAWIFESASI